MIKDVLYILKSNILDKWHNFKIIFRAYERTFLFNPLQIWDPQQAFTRTATRTSYHERGVFTPSLCCSREK